jgi:uncharacterized protein with NRDE domain
MCLILFAYKIHPRYKFILAANRDEFYERPTAVARFWEDAPEVLAGRDLAQGGTWLGVTRSGRLAAVTNFRNPHQSKGKFSRGALVSDFLRGTDSVLEYLQKIENEAENYTGFNLLVGDFGNDEMAYFSNRGDGIKLLDAGIYGLSNALLDTPWQKVLRGKNNLEKIISAEEISPDSLFQILQNRTLANDEDLPETGVGIEYERILSPCFIETPIYGTRSSSVVLVGNDNSLNFAEQSFHPPLDRMTESFSITIADSD